MIDDEPHVIDRWVWRDVPRILMKITAFDLMPVVIVFAAGAWHSLLQNGILVALWLGIPALSLWFDYSTSDYPFALDRPGCFRTRQRALALIGYHVLNVVVIQIALFFYLRPP